MTAADKEEQDDWKPVGKAGKSHADVVKRREKHLPVKPEGLHASHREGAVVDLADFILAAEEPPELGGLLVPDGISATLIALPTMRISHPTQELSAPTLCRCCEGTESGDVAMENAGFPSGMEADCCFVSGCC